MRLARCAIWISLLLVPAVFVSRTGLVSKQAVQAPITQTQQPARPASPPPQSRGFVEVSVDYGAQLLLSDGQGRRTGYDPATSETLNGIPHASYADDSISDATDDSTDAATAESRVLDIQSEAAGRYSLSVFGTDRASYDIQFFCKGENGPAVNVSAHALAITRREEHLYRLSIAPDCSRGLVSGAFAERTPAENALLTYAYPASDHMELVRGARFRMVIVYDRRVDSSTFSATLNGRSIADLFHPKPNSIEAVAIPVASGRNVVQLNVSGTSETGSALIFTDTFVVEAQGEE